MHASPTYRRRLQTGLMRVEITAIVTLLAALSLIVVTELSSLRASPSAGHAPQPSASAEFIAVGSPVVVADRDIRP